MHSGEVARALQVVGDRWSFLLMRDAFLGVRRFEDLRRRTGASRGTFTARLNAMVDSGLLYRSPYGSAPSRLEYRLTEKGLAFYPVALCMWTWENRWGGEFGLPPRLVHTRVREDSEPGPRLQSLRLRDHLARNDLTSPARARTATRQRMHNTATGERQPRRMATASIRRCSFVDTVGDRWTALLVGALFFGLHRYDDINAALGIATNILADRLRRLLAAGVIEQRLYQDHPPRHEYHLTEKGWDLLQFTIAMHDWGTRWIDSPDGPGVILRHRPCGRRLRLKLVCGSCGGTVEARDVEIRGTTRWPARQARGGQGKKPLVRRT